MFTGIITDIGTVKSVEGETEKQLRISCSYDPATIDIGASIACNGCCLTVTAKSDDRSDSWFEVTISSESLSKTTLGSWQEGTQMNLERALRHGDELGGHLVSGHVDGVAEIISKKEDQDSIIFEFKAPKELMKYIAPKGSITLNGTSLTVNHVEGRQFDVMMIPHTLTHTIWGIESLSHKGCLVNLEIDMLARYAEKLSH